MKSVLEDYPRAKAEVMKAAEVAGYLWQKGWAERNGGNITVNITELVDVEALSKLPAIGPVTPIGMTLPNIKGGIFYCKGTGCRMRDLARHPMDNGSIIRVLPDGENYEMIADNPVKPTSELPSHLAIHDDLIGNGSNEMPSSIKLAEETVKGLQEHNVVLWEKHGVVAIGNDALEAFDEIDVLVKSAQIYQDAKSMGFEPEGMSDESMNELKEAFNL